MNSGWKITAASFAYARFKGRYNETDFLINFFQKYNLI